MRSSYKRIGDYVQQVNVRNSGLAVTNLQGVSINKYFMPSVANVNGTDLSTYKVVCKDQFAFNPMHVGRDEVLPIAMLETDDPVIVSPAYAVFEIINKQVLLPEYLMMWCRRPDFDRNAWFTTDSSVRGGFSWDDFCEMRLPVPSPEKQQEIVKEYHTIVDRIKQNERLNRKLEETAQAIYRQWFVDFEFPISAEYATAICKPELEGQPYKSSGGEMVFNDVLKQEIPDRWDYVTIQTLIDKHLIEKNQDGNHGEIHPKSTDFSVNGVAFIMATDINDGVLNLKTCKFIPQNVAKKLRIGFARTGDVLLTHKATMGRVCIVPRIPDYIVLTPQVTYYRVSDFEKMNKEYLYSVFTSDDFQRNLVSDSGQSTRDYLSITNQRSLKIMLPDSATLTKYSSVLDPILALKPVIMKEIEALKDLCQLVESKMAQSK